MSLKSFDKFCESMITGKGVREKIIYDERQKILQMKLWLETMGIFIIAGMINILIMDKLFNYAESYLFPMLLILIICIFYYQFRCVACGCFIGINGVRPMKVSAIWAIFIGFFDSFIFIFDEDVPLILSDGKISDRLFGIIMTASVVIYGIVMLIVLHNIEKKNKQDTI